ncbi:MAG: site-specific integrase [Mangrovibacterium sp.]
MAKIRFHINKSKIDKENYVPIRAKISIDSTARYKAIEKVKLRYWNPKKQRVIPNRETEPYNRHKEINELIEKYEEKARQYFNDLKLNGIPVNLKAVEDFFEGKPIATKVKNLWEAYDLYLQAGKLEKAYNTNRNRKTIHTKLKEFEEKTGYKITFESINLEFWDRLKEYILVDQNHGFNYLAAIADKFKAFMNWSHERKFHENLAFKKFSAPEKEISIISLTWEELQQLINFEFANNKLAKARDFFCFGCLTGLRYVDLVQLTKDNITDGMIRITTQKTNKEVIIPVFPGLQTIIDRYPEQYKLLPKFSNQKINEYIKECCELAGITVLTEFKTFVKNVTVKEFRPKHELIGTHTARKTFISLAYERGLDIEMIKAITGITREKTLKRYLQISNHTKKEKLMAAFNALGEVEKST